MSLKNKQANRSIVVVVHDAGGAEIIGAYIRAQRGKHIFHAYGAGPAVRVFKRLKIPLRIITDDSHVIAAVMNKHVHAAYALIAAPGWMTRIEIRALLAARRVGIKTVVYMDSWIDERVRFGYPKKDWQKNVPDEFWVGDTYARAHLRVRYPHIPLRFVPNQYHVNGLRRYRALKRTAPKHREILFVSQDGSQSQVFLKEILHVLGNRDERSRLRIRFHPADKHTRYDALLRLATDRVTITTSREADIVDDLVRARLVIGTETGAMAMAVLCGIKTISLVARGRKPILPFPSIKRIRSPKDIRRLI